jgi:hypothetical protein
MTESDEHARVQAFLHIILPICWKGHWLSISEMTELTKLHPASIRWCIKQLRTGEEGGFQIRRRKRQPEYKGITEYYIKRKPAQMRFTFEG